MDDLISRQQAIDVLKEAFNPSITNFVKAKIAIDALPSAQPEIIQCRDCRYYNSEEKECLDLLGHGRRWEEDDFCSYGVKMEEVTE